MRGCAAALGLGAGPIISGYGWSGLSLDLGTTPLVGATPPPKMQPRRCLTGSPASGTA
jgi:hypothetical protein